MASPLVGILMGSDSDLPVMVEAKKACDEFGVETEVRVLSAHRSPAAAIEYARSAQARGLKAVICGAGAAAHLAGVIASSTPLPVIGVPIQSGALNGLDALLSTAQMPPGIPVATVAVNGARNAGLLAVQILGTADDDLRARFDRYKQSLAAAVEKKNEDLAQKIREMT